MLRKMMTHEDFTGIVTGQIDIYLPDTTNACFDPCRAPFHCRTVCFTLRFVTIPFSNLILILIYKCNTFIGNKNVTQIQSLQPMSD